MATTSKEKANEKMRLGDAMEAYLRRGVEGEAPGRRMKNYSPRSARRRAHGKRALLFGIPFFLLGLFIVGVGTGIVPTKESSSDAPPIVIALCGVIFAVPGLGLMVHGAAGMRRVARVRAMREQFIGEPWRADYSWNEQGIGDTQARGVFQMLYGTLFMVLFAAPFNILAYESGNGWVMALVSVCVNLFVAVFALTFFYRLARWMKYGSGRVRFGRFPFYLGEKIDLTYVPARGLRGVKKMTCTLRCIREVYEARDTSDGRQEQVVAYETYGDAKDVDGSALGEGFDRSLSLSFDAPTGGETTRLSDRPAVYWELEVSAKTPGVDLNSRFLVPVYGRGGRLE
ncbi:MAG: hypothetical protein IPK83_19960 [Planctomycetes bacterium]|nr:hypothetical protein [Planctomycetota bacterium]